MCLVLMAWVGGLMAQRHPLRYQIRNFGERDGLVVQGITRVAQDAYGFIWIGSQKGLIAYDGTHSRVFSLPEAPVDGFYNRVTALITDAEGKLWLGTKNGIFAYDHQTEQMNRLKVEGMPEVVRVEMMQFAPDGELWAIINGKASVIDLKERKMRTVGDEMVQPTCLTVARDGQVWMGDVAGVLYRYDAVSGRFRAYTVKPEGVTHWGELRAITEMKDGSLAVTTAVDGACLFSLEDLESTMLFDCDDEGLPVVAHTAITPDGVTLMVGSERGIVMCSVKDHSMAYLRQSHNLSNTLSDNAVHSLFFDKEQGVWVGTYFGGINRLSIDGNSFTTYIPEDDVDVMREMVVDAHGRFWVGAEDGGICLFDREKEVFVPADIVWGNNPKPYNIQSLILVGDELWASSLTNGIYVIDTETRRVKRRYTATNLTEMGRPLAVNTMCVQSGVVFAGTRHGVYVFNREEESFDLIREMHDADSHKLYADHKGHVWVATFNKGLWKVERKKDGWKAQKTPFAYQCNTTVMEDSEGIIWVGTDRKGVMRYNPADGTTTSLDVSERLVQQTVTHIMEDGNKCLWISTLDGIYYYDERKKTMNHFTMANGLPTKFLNYSSGYVDADGTMYVGTYKGLVRFNPASFVVSHEKLKPYFLDLTVGDQRIVPNDSTRILEKTLKETKEIKLSYLQSTFSIAYAVPSYRIGKVVWYRYRLNPDEPWIVVDHAQLLQLNNLSVGKYELSLQASYDPDVWSGDAAVLYITVEPPTWLNGWSLFMYLIVFVILAIVFLMVWRNRWEKKHLEQLHTV